MILHPGDGYRGDGRPTAIGGQSLYGTGGAGKPRTLEAHAITLSGDDSADALWDGS